MKMARTQWIDPSHTDNEENLWVKKTIKTAHFSNPFTRNKSIVQASGMIRMFSKNGLKLIKIWGMANFTHAGMPH